MILMKQKIKFCFFCLFTAVFCISCRDVSSFPDHIKLSDWEIRTGIGWIKTEPVPWETPIEMGGPGLKGLDGFACYRISFRIPAGMRGKVLAFYTPSIDDADRAFLNGHLIGETGRVPSSVKNDNAFQSGIRLARFYRLPQHLIDYNGLNHLVLNVFDYSGKGGFAYKQQPVIGPADFYSKLSELHRFRNDIPRTVFLSFLLFICIFFSVSFYQHLKKTPLVSFYKRAVQPYLTNPLRSVRTGIMSISDTEISSRYFYGLVICLLSFFFIFSEVTFKYCFIGSEVFWFKFPAAFSMIQFSVLLAFFYPDVFGDLPGSKKNIFFFLKLISAVLTHPAIPLTFGLILLCLPAYLAWNQFTVTGISYCFCAITLLFSATAVQMLKVRKHFSEEDLSGKLKREGILRLCMIGAMGVACALWGWSFIYSHAALFQNTFLIVYMLNAMYFMITKGISLPVPVPDTGPLFTLLQNEFFLTYREAEISCLIQDGLDRDRISIHLGISKETLKKHLRSVYSKTIEKDSTVVSGKRDKLQRLTVFLNGVFKN